MALETAAAIPAAIGMSILMYEDDVRSCVAAVVGLQLATMMQTSLTSCVDGTTWCVLVWGLGV